MQVAACHATCIMHHTQHLVTACYAMHFTHQHCDHSVPAWRSLHERTLFQQDACCSYLHEQNCFDLYSHKPDQCCFNQVNPSVYDISHDRGAIYSHFYTKIEIWSIKLGWGVIHSFTWIFSMVIQIPESKFTPLTMINVIIFKIFTTFHCKCYFLMDRVWPSKCNISK